MSKATTPSTMDTDHPSPHRARAPGWQLLVALFLAPAAFLGQVVAAYVIATSACGAGAGPRAPLLAVHLGAILAAVAGFAMSLLLWRRTREEKPGDATVAIDRGEGRTRFLALCGLYASAVFLVAVLVDASAVLLLGACPSLLPAPA